MSDDNRKSILIELTEFADFYQELLPFGVGSPEAIIREVFTDLNGLYRCCEAKVNGETVEYEMISHTSNYIAQCADNAFSEKSAEAVKVQCAGLLRALLKRVSRMTLWTENHYYPAIIDVDGTASYSVANITIRCTYERNHTKRATELYTKLAKGVLRNYASWNRD